MRFHVESPRQRTGSTHAQMTNFLLPDSCTTTTEDFSLCAPCVFPRSLISGYICVRVHLSHLSVCLSTCALPCARRCWCGCWRMRRLVSSRRRRWLLSGTNTSSGLKLSFVQTPLILPSSRQLERVWGWVRVSEGANANTRLGSHCEFESGETPTTQ